MNFLQKTPKNISKISEFHKSNMDDNKIVLAVWKDNEDIFLAIIKDINEVNICSLNKGVIAIQPLKNLSPYNAKKIATKLMLVDKNNIIDIILKEVNKVNQCCSMLSFFKSEKIKLTEKQIIEINKLIN